MQTFATDSDSPPSRNVLIDGNRCERIDNQCLIAEGPESVAGDGAGWGYSGDITFSYNFCDVHASQATEIDDVQRVRVIGNNITGTPDKAFSFQNNATDAVVAANTLAKQIKYQVGMDASSRSGYLGRPSLALRDVSRWRQRRKTPKVGGCAPAQPTSTGSASPRALPERSSRASRMPARVTAPATRNTLL
jgi:hypothetical protein